MLSDNLELILRQRVNEKIEQLIGEALLPTASAHDLSELVDFIRGEYWRGVADGRDYETG